MTFYVYLFRSKPLVLASTIVASVVVVSGCESRQARFDECLARLSVDMEKKMARACESDPKFVVCASEEGRSVIGSGCPSRVEYSIANSAGDDRFQRRNTFCKKWSAKSDHGVWEECRRRTGY